MTYNPPAKIISILHFSVFIIQLLTLSYNAFMLHESFPGSCHNHKDGQRPHHKKHILIPRQQPSLHPTAWLQQQGALPFEPF